MLELEAMRTLRRALNAEGLLTGNEPAYRFTCGRGDDHDFIRDQLRRDGFDLEAGPNREVLDASDALYANINRTPPNGAAANLVALWREAVALLTLIDANPGLHDQVDRSAWGHVSNAVERVASSQNYAPDIDGLPDLETMFAVLERLSSSRYPKPREDEG